MFKSYKYRIHPTEDQKVLIEKTFGCCRLVYNLALQVKVDSYKSAEINLSGYDLCKQLSPLKREFPWLKEVDSQALNESVMRVETNFKRYFKGMGFPNLISKKGKQSFRCQNNKREIDWDKSTLTIPKLKNIPIVLSRKFDGKIKTVTITKTPTGKYFASILVDDGKELPTPQPVQIEKSVGIDTGIKSFVVTSDGRTFEANRKLKDSEDRLKVLQRRASKKQKGSANRKKANLKVALMYEKITNKRHDYIHKVVSELTSDNQAVSTIFVEDLNIRGMLSNRRLAQAISDVSLGKFYEILGYKCKWKGINLIKIGRYDPSSKRCNACGEINQSLTLKDRTWKCSSCGTNLDRDENAAQNILWYGIQYLNNKTGAGSSEEPVEEPTLVGPVKQEMHECELVN